MLFRAVATPHEAIAGAPGRAIAEWPHAALNFLALEPLKLQKSALPAAILLIAAAAFLNYMVLLVEFASVRHRWLRHNGYRIADIFAAAALNQLPDAPEPAECCKPASAN